MPIHTREGSPRRYMVPILLFGPANPTKGEESGRVDLISRLRLQRTRTLSLRPSLPRCAPRGRRAAPHPTVLGPIRWRPGRSRQNGRLDESSRWDDVLRLAPIRSENPALGSPGGTRCVGWTIPDRSMVERERTSDDPIKLRVHRPLGKGRRTRPTPSSGYDPSSIDLLHSPSSHDPSSPWTAEEGGCDGSQYTWPRPNSGVKLQQPTTCRSIHWCTSKGVHWWNEDNPRQRDAIQSMPTRAMDILRKRLLALLCAGILASVMQVDAYTDPEEMERLLLLRQALRNRLTDGWDYAISTWTCPGEPGHQGPPGEMVVQWDGQIRQECDPCGSDPTKWGNWGEIACFGGYGAPPGRVTTVHVTDLVMGIRGGVQTEVPPEFCLLSELREFDLDGNDLVGTIPNWIPACFPHLDELDLSYNKLTGPIPSWMDMLPHAREFKLEHNLLTGRIPEGFSKMDSIKVIRLEHNQLAGRLPDDFDGFVIEALWLHENPDLCGPMEAIQADRCSFMECGIVTSNTRIGRRCRSDVPGVAEITPVETLYPCEFESKHGRPIEMDLPVAACEIIQNL